MARHKPPTMNTIRNILIGLLGCVVMILIWGLSIVLGIVDAFRREA